MSKEEKGAPTVYMSSWEGAQYGNFTLEKFLDSAQAAGAHAAQPSNYQLHKPGSESWELRPVDEVLQLFAARNLEFAGISAHCPYYVATGGVRVYGGDVNAFVRKDMLDMEKDEDVEKAMVDYLLGLQQWSADAKNKLIAQFWGPLYYICARGRVSANLDSRYYWPFQKEGGWEEGRGNFLKLSDPLRKDARDKGIKLAHELHPKSAAWSAEEWEQLIDDADGDESMQVNFDPSHFWAGQPWWVALRHPAVASRVVMSHAKSFELVDGKPVISMHADWRERGHQFCPLDQGEVDMAKYARTLIEVGYPKRHTDLSGNTRAPMVVEAEAAHEDGLATSLRGISHINERCCWFTPAHSFEDTMGDNES